jgi:shikimate dehydrogenase
LGSQGINSRTGLYCIIGNPIEHSMSPPMHNAAFQALKLNCVYSAFKVESFELDEAVKGLKSIGIKGFTITVPHKQAVIRLLDEVDEYVERVGAANTVLNENGKLVGFNTDGIGFVRAVGEDLLKEKRVVILGAGGAARSLAYETVLQASSLLILNRTLSRAVDLVYEISKYNQRNIEVKAMPLNNESLEHVLKTCHLLVNTTTIGMYPHLNETPVPIGLLNSDMTVFDAVFNPYKTKLLRDAEMVGARIVSGLDMLVYVSVESFRIWFRREPPIQVMRNVGMRALQRLAS